MDSLMMDLRFTLRTLRRNPGFTTVALLTVALGIGANTALFSIVNAVLLRPLPYSDPDRLVWLGREMPELKAELLGSVDYFNWKDRSRSLESIAAFEGRGQEMNLSGGQGPERVRGTRASRDLFDLLGVRPALGRIFTADEDQPGGPRTVVLMHGFWKRRFGSNPGIVGETLVLDDEPRTVVGIMPAGFKFPRQPALDVIEPMQLSRPQAEAGGIRRIQLCSAIGRLRAGVALGDAHRELKRISESSPISPVPTGPGSVVTHGRTGPGQPGGPVTRPPGELRIEIGPGPETGLPANGRHLPGDAVQNAPVPPPTADVPVPAPPGGSTGQPTGPGRMYSQGPPPGAKGPSPAGPMGPMRDPMHEAEIKVTPLHEKIVGNVKPALLILLGAVTFVLLIACVNVANLLLARATARQKEMTIRAALGASRTRVVRQLLTESVVLSAGGGILGLVFAYWAIRIFVMLVPAGPAGNVFQQLEFGIDGRALGFLAFVSVLTGILFGLAPGLAATRIDLNDSLKEGVTRLSPHRHALRASLVVMELTLALMLLSGAGLLLNSFARVLSQDLGYRPNRVLTMALDLGERRYPGPSERKAFFRELLPRLRSIPGVRAAGLSTSLPLSEPNMVFRGLQIEGRPESDDDPAVYASSVTDGYFPAIGMRLMQGRFFDEHDDAQSPRVAIINEAMAAFFWPGKDALGKRFRIGPVFGGATVVGVVANARRQTLESAPRPEIYLSYLQVPDIRFMQLALRTGMDPYGVVSAVRTTVAALDSELAVYEISSLDQKVATAIAPRRYNLLLIGSFAAIALLLSAIGLYGLMDYAVARRRHEIGVRMALGAQRKDVLKLIVKQGMTLAAIGVATGLGGSIAVTRVLRSQLYGVTATDPVTFCSAAGVLVIVALAATYIPADKATNVDPVDALRYEWRRWSGRPPARARVLPLLRPTGQLLSYATSLSHGLRQIQPRSCAERNNARLG